MKRTRNYILLVDYNTPPRFAHRTKGRYRVGAHSEKEAVRLLQKAIGFGSIRVYRLCPENDAILPMGEVRKEVPYQKNKKTVFVLEKARHATAPLDNFKS